MGLPWEHRREGETTLSGPKLKRQKYLHGTKDAAAKQQTQMQTPQMQGHDDIPQPEKEQKLQEVEEPHDGGIRQEESFPGLGQGSCMTESNRRWRSIPRNQRRGYGGRRHDNNPYPPSRQEGHQVSQILPSPPFRRQKRDRQHHQDLDDEGG